MIGDMPMDPRAKLCIVTCISTIAVMEDSPWVLGGLCALVLLLNILMKSLLLHMIKRCQRLMSLLIMMVCVQSIFNMEGQAILGIGSIHILTDVGLNRGMVTVMRMAIMILSGALLMTCSARVFIQGLIQMKIPYELAFMVMIGLKWIPLLGEEFQDALTALRLRGIKIKELSLIKKVRLYTYMIMPVLTGTIIRSQKMAIAMSAKGLRVMDRRTSYFTLQLSWYDYVAMGVSISLTIGYLLLF